MVKRLCADDPEAMDLIDRATQNPAHIHRRDTNNVNVTPEGNTAQAAIRRLRKDRPDLHAAVLAGAKSPHGAMDLIDRATAGRQGGRTDLVSHRNEVGSDLVDIGHEVGRPVIVDDR